MNSAQRLLATLGGQPVDRRAVVPLLSLYGARLTGCPLDRYYTDPLAYCAGQVAVASRFRPDVVFSPFIFAAFGECFGSTLHTSKTQPPTVARPATPDLGELESLCCRAPDEHPRLRFLQDAVSILRKEIGHETLIASPIPLPTDIPALIAGLDTWMHALLFEPETARRIMDSLVPWFSRVVADHLGRGANLIISASTFSSDTMLPRDIVRSLLGPVIVKTLEQVPGPVLLHHGGAPMGAHLDLLSGARSVVGCILHESDDLGQSRAKAPAEYTIGTGPAGPALPFQDKDQCLRVCLSHLEKAASDRRFLLCTTGADIPLDTPEACIHAIREAAELHGGAA